jgi:hypothetical protein
MAYTCAEAIGYLKSYSYEDYPRSISFGRSSHVDFLLDSYDIFLIARHGECGTGQVIPVRLPLLTG